jgi:predicted porin
MTRTLLLMAMTASAVLLASGVAFAATFYGTDGNDDIRGTEQARRV